MLIRNLLSKITHLNPVPRVLAISTVGLVFTLSLALILNGFTGLQTVLTENEVRITDSQAAAALSAKRSKSGEAVSQKQALETDRIIVKFKEDSLPPGFSVAAEKANLESAEGLKKLFTIAGIGADVYEVPSDSTSNEVVQRIKYKSKDVLEYAEVDMLVPPALIPNDQYFANQWHHNNLKSPKGWDTALGTGVSIAILDTGVDPNHSDLEFSDQPGWNFYDNNSNWSDVASHGTSVAGAAAAVGNNTIGVSGVAPNAKILPIRIASPATYAYYSAMANGITYAANHGARVVNLSYEGACSSSLVLDAAKYLRSKGGVFVGAAGNSGGDNGYPASDAVTCVTATGSNDLRTSWSSFGVATDLTAPGSGIYSTAPGGGYGAVSGTSFSSPITAGVYALMFSINPALTPSQADSILFSTAKDVGDAGWDKYYGFGLVDIEKAVALASSTIGTLGIPDTTPPSVPSNLKIATITHNSISMTWGPSTDDRAMAQYSVYRNGIKIATIGNTAYTATGLSSETDYSFTVRAEDAVLNQSGDSNTVIVKTAAAPFGISTYSVPTKTATSAAVSVILTKPGTVIVKFGTSATSLSASVQSMAANTTHTLSLAGLAAGTTYYYQVSATDVSGTVTSAISSFKTQRLSGGGKRR